MKFKEGDLVRCINVGDFTAIVLNKLYIINDNTGNYVYLKNYNKTSIDNGWVPKRFKKVTRKDMSEEEKFSYMKYKLGIKE